MSIVIRFATCVLAFAIPYAIAGTSSSAQEDARWSRWLQHCDLAERSLFHGLPWRCVGPVEQGGRVVDIEAIPGQPYAYYIAYASGGVWITTNNGLTLAPLFDYTPCTIIGDLAVDPQHPDRLWVGTGENNSSRSSYGGCGVFRSDDRGATWQYLGLSDTDRIGRILVDPRNGDRAYVGAVGKLFTSGGARGVFRTQDGGKTWSNVLFVDERSGCIDLAMDPGNPDVLYAAFWERIRRPWNFEESGPGSGIYRSTDGGSTWSKLSGGFPQGSHVGRIGLAAAPSRPGTLYAFLDNQEPAPEEPREEGEDAALDTKKLRAMTKEDFLAQEDSAVDQFLQANGLSGEIQAAELKKKIGSGELTLQKLLDALGDANASLFETEVRGAEVWRSDDSGTTWRRTHEKPLQNVVFTYGYYFGHVRVSPKDAERIYITGVPLLTSADGGATFTGLRGDNVHADHHVLWIDPEFPDRLLLGNDGGINQSFDGGKTWLQHNHCAVGQFYTVHLDMATPYNIYGGLQDNGVWKGPSTSTEARSGAWESIFGGDGMYVQVDLRDNATVYTGFQFGNYSRLGPQGSTSITPKNSIELGANRFNWCTPVQLSPHSADVVYFGAQRLYRSLNRGETWKAISGDLTTSTERGDVPFGTITTLAESPKSFGLIWVGTDDGHVQVTKDGGVDWHDVSKDLPDLWVTRVEPSRHDEATAYVSFSGYREDDANSYLFRTADFGQTWESLSAGLPAEPVNVVREDPGLADLLYVGTDRGAFVTLDRGATWHALSGGLPHVPVHDLAVHPRDQELVAGTHGRSVWVLDVSPIQSLHGDLLAKALHLFPVESVNAMRLGNPRGASWYRSSADEPKHEILFWTKQGGELELSFRDDQGSLLRCDVLEVGPGLHVHEYDLKVDPELALAAEERRAQSAEADKKPARPWKKAMEEEQPLYLVAGSYQIRLESEAGVVETSFEVSSPGERTRGRR